MTENAVAEKARAAAQRLKRSQFTVIDGVSMVPQQFLHPQEAQHSGQARMAYRVAASWQNKLMYVPGLGWHWWDGVRWAEDSTGRAKQAVLDTLRHAWEFCFTGTDQALERDVRRLQNDNAINGILNLAATMPELVVPVHDVDADPYSLNCRDGTLDLQTLEIRDHNPADHITKVAGAAFGITETGSTWANFIKQALPDPEVRDYFQRIVGLSLLGAVREHVFAIATGTGANGKGTAYNAILNALGDYGHAAESDLFMSTRSNPNAASPAVFRLRGKRFVVVSETERDHKLATALMKNLTGGDPITARPLYGAPVTFMPSHTALMVTNWLPRVAGDDPAAWRRIRVIPFDQVFTGANADPKLGEKLAAEADAVLQWAIQGWVIYQQEGLGEPEAVKAATDDYMRSMDAIGRFIDDKCVISPAAHVALAELYDEWQTWAVGDGSEAMSKRSFTEALRRHGYVTARGGHGGSMVVRRLGIRTEGDE